MTYHGDIFRDNESYAIKHYMKMFAELASATLKQVADWFVWLASTLGRFFDERSGRSTSRKGGACYRRDARKPSTMPMSSYVPTMKSTTLPMADTMDAYRSSNKGCQDRQLLYDSSPINWSLAYLLMCEPIASIIRISVNFFLYGSNFCFFTALGLMPRVSPCSLQTKDSLYCC